MSYPYGAHETKIFYVEESSGYGVTPTSPVFFGVKAESVESPLDPGLIKVRGIGSRDLQMLKKGLRQIALKIAYPLPSDAPINLLLHVQTLNSLSLDLIYEKSGAIIDLLHTGCRIDKVNVEFSIEDVIKATIDVIGKDVLVRNAHVTGATYLDYAGAVDESYVQRGNADGSGLVDVGRVSDWKFTIENNLKRVPVIRQNQFSLLTGTAASGQKVCAVADGTKFQPGDMVKIQDDSASEWNIVNSISTNNLTMLNNLVNTYTVAANGKVTSYLSHVLKYLPVRHRNNLGELTFDFESKQEFDDVINDSEFSLKFGLGGSSSAVFKYCKWERVNPPTKIEDLVYLKAPFVARDVFIS
jgi:hypothetical protein